MVEVKNIRKTYLSFLIITVFKIITTNPRRGNEKGDVEQGGKVIRKELFTFNYEFNSLDDLRQYTKDELIKLNNKSQVNFKDEQINLLQLPTD